MNLSHSIVPAQRLFAERYRIVSQLGSGGFGIVYEAEQVATGQMVALKLLHRMSDLAPEEQRMRSARFIREVTACARLNHPHVVRLLDGGETLDNILFACFSLVPGCDLQVILKRGPLAVDEAIRLMGQVLAGLAAAHEAGVVHRDLKPANIMVSSGILSYATILDFGTGALLDRTLDDTGSRLTGQGGFIGTPSYAAPEQLRGAMPTPRSDLYSWGLLFLECLTGKQTISGSTAAEIWAQQCSQSPIAIPPPFAQHALGQLLARALEKDVSKRTISAREALTELNRLDLASLDEGADSRISTVARAFVSMPAAGERRQVASLIFDWQFTGNSQALTLDELELAVRWLTARMNTIAQRFNAYVVAMVGSRAQLLFGYPRNNEDDSVRAVHAGLALVALTDQLPERLRMAGLGVSIRVGIETGMVILRPRPNGQGTIEVIGPPVLTATDLASQAGKNQILVGVSTAHIVDSRFELERQESVESAPPSHSWAYLVSARKPRVTVASRHVATPRIALVGRQHELGLLHTRWQQCLAGAGKGILVCGEAGVGKSRLARELLRQAATDGVCVELGCTHEDQASPLFPILEFLEHLIDPTGKADSSARLGALRELLRNSGLDGEQGVDLLAPLLGIEPTREALLLDISSDRRRELTLELLTDLILELSRDTPLLVLVEDLHWADASTLKLLERVVACAQDSTLLVLMTARKERCPSMTDVWQLDLDPLPQDAVRAMLEHLVPARMAESLIDEVVARTDGICLYVEEIGSAIAEHGTNRGIDSATTVEHLPELLLPLRLQALLAMRLDAVGSARATAQVAAVIGREFSLELLALVSPLTESALRQDIRTLLEFDLIREIRHRQGQLYAFKHALIRESAYESLVASERRAAHAAVAEALGSKLARLSAQRPELLAEHLAKSEQYATAIDYALRAAAAALRRSANEEARSLSLKAETWLEKLAEHDERERLELALNGVALPALMACWRWADPTVRQKATRSLELLRAAPASPEQARILWALSVYYMVLADRKNCRAVAEQQVRLAEQLSDEGMKAAALNSLACTLLDEGQFTSALSVTESALGLFDPVRDANHGVLYGLHTGSFTRSLRSLSLCHLGRFQSSMVESELAEQSAIRGEHSASQVLALFYRALIQALLENRPETHRFCEVGMQLAQKGGHLAQVGYFACLDAWATDNVELIRRSVGGLEQLGYGLALPFYQSLWAEVESRTGHGSNALDISKRAIEASRETGNVSYLAVNLSDALRYALAQGALDIGAAEESFQEALLIAQSQHSLLQELKVRTQLAQLRSAAGDSLRAAETLEDCLARAGEDASIPVVERAQMLLRNVRPPGANLI